MIALHANSKLSFLLATGLVGISIPAAGQIVVSGNRLVDEAPALLEYSEAGVLQREIAVVPPPGIGDFVLRDVAVDRYGRMHVVARSHVASSGNLTLCTYDGSGWSHLTVPDWSQLGNTTYGGMAVNDDYLRFPLDDLSNFTHFPTAEFHTVTMGLNGLLYATERYGECQIFHPGTMSLVANLGSFVLYRGDSVIDLCVGPRGDIFTIDLGNKVTHFDAFGGFVAELENVGPCGDIEIRGDGTLIVGLADQRVLAGTTELQGFTGFATNPVDDPAAWIRNHLTFSPVAALPAPVAPRAVVTGVKWSGTGLEIRFERSPGVGYKLWSSGGLEDWSELPTAESGSGTDGLFQLGSRPEGGRGFFRIESRYPAP
jgi:hypothetical protein